LIYKIIFEPTYILWNVFISSWHINDNNNWWRAKETLEIYGGVKLGRSIKETLEIYGAEKLGRTIIEYYDFL